MFFKLLKCMPTIKYVFLLSCYFMMCFLFSCAHDTKKNESEDTLLNVEKELSNALIVSKHKADQRTSVSMKNAIDDTLINDVLINGTLVNRTSNTEHAIDNTFNDALLHNVRVKPEDERFNVSVNNVPARVFFLNLVADSGVNVVAHPDVEGKVSLELKNVTVPEVLEITRDVYGYEYNLMNGIYTIYARKLRTEIYPIDYPDIQRVGVTDTSVLIGKITSDSSSSSSGGSSGSSSATEDSANLLSLLGGESSNSSESLSPGARVQTLNKTDFWPGLHQTLMAIVGEGDGRMVMTNPQSGLVVVKGFPKELQSVREFLNKSELSVKRQVVLETKILEVILNDEYESGINWSAISGELAISQSITGSDSLSNVIFDNKNVSEVLFTSAFNVADITNLISLLNRQGSVQVLSSPRISTVNNQKAVIRVGSDEFFVTGISNSTTSSASAVTSTPDIQLSSFFSGISLDVTPQISENGDVIIHVHPLVSSVVDQQKDITVGDDSFSLPLALRDVRESDSIVRAKNGQVVVLGGLMQESSSDVDTRRSFLGDVPILNVFFKHKQKTKTKTELVILMRPIVVDSNTWSDELSRSNDSFKYISDEYRERLQ